MQTWTDARRGELVAMWLAGRKAGEIADSMETSREAVLCAAVDIGLPPRRQLGAMAPEAGIRRCMCCRGEFFSQWKGNRLCVRCKGGEA